VRELVAIAGSLGEQRSGWEIAALHMHELRVSNGVYSARDLR